MTQKDLAILKAAMQFWDEEMSSHGIYTYNAYFQEKLPDNLKVSDFKLLREKLRHCKLQYLQYDHLFETVFQSVLLDSTDKGDLGKSPDTIRIATVLIFEDS